jgi:hypothetical protein
MGIEFFNETTVLGLIKEYLLKPQKKVYAYVDVKTL